MKKFLILISLCSTMCSFSQEVSVIFSTEWKKTKCNNWRFHKLKQTPYLNLTYRNNSLNAVYFLKTPQNFDIQTYDSPLSIDKSAKKDLSYFEKKLKHNGEKYFVKISNSFNHIWQVKDEIENKNIEETVEVDNNKVNKDLQEIYKNLYKEYKYIATYAVFLNSKGNNIIITPENIAQQFNDYFVFLKPGERYVDTYDLTGFYILGGQYNFSLNNNKAQDFVETIFLENQKAYKIEMLPKDVKGYKLFSGTLVTNSVDITFK